MKPCAACGKPLENPTPKQRYCDKTCAKRGQRKTQNAPTEPAPKRVGLVNACRKLLTDAQMLETAQGEVVMTLAERLENSQYDTAAAVASLSKELRAALDAVNDKAVPAVDPMDELQQRRLKRNAG